MPKTVEKNYIEKERLEIEIKELLDNAFVEYDKSSGTYIVNGDLKEQIIDCIKRQPEYV